MKLSSSAFQDGENIPSEYTCDGEDTSPPLSISDVSSEAESLALVVDDPDAPGSTFDHWIIWNISPDTDSIPEAIPQEESIDSLGNAVQGKNDFGELGYRGPCPPSGPAHDYVFKLYALDKELDLDSGASKKELESEMKENIVSKDQIVGVYGR